LIWFFVLFLFVLFRFEGLVLLRRASFISIAVLLSSNVQENGERAEDKRDVAIILWCFVALSLHAYFQVFRFRADNFLYKMCLSAVCCVCAFNLFAFNARIESDSYTIAYTTLLVLVTIVAAFPVLFGIVSYLYSHPDLMKCFSDCKEKQADGSSETPALPAGDTGGTVVQGLTFSRKRGQQSPHNGFVDQCVEDEGCGY